MASILKVDDLRGNTAAGDITITSEGGAATMQLQQGLCKAWVGYETVSGTSILDSFNTSSITDNGTGDNSPQWTNSFANDDYAASGIAAIGGRRMFVHGGSKSNQTTSQIRNMTAGENTAAHYDCDQVACMAVGDLA